MTSYLSLLGDESAWLNVFARLDLKDLVKCRKVCRSWREMVDLNLRLNTLVLHTNAYPCQRWTFDHEPLNASESLQVNNLDRFFASSLVNSVLKNIKKLIVCSYQFDKRIPIKSFDLNAVNNFSELRQLEIFEFKSRFSREHCRLVLGNLKFLKLKFKDKSVELETPRLSTIIGDLSRLHLNYPEAVRVWKTDYCDKKRLKELVNLQYLFCESIQSVDNDFLLNLKSLKVILFFNKNGFRCADVFRKLHKQKQELNRKDLQIQFMGIEFEASEFPIYDLAPRERLFNSNKSFRWYELNEQGCQIYFVNSSKIAPMIPFVKRLQFKLVDQNLDKLQFFRRFVDIREIVVNCELKNATVFLKFIRNQSRLQTLEFDNSKFAQSNFDSLDRFVPKLTNLYVLNEPNVICFDFAVKLQNLVVLKTDQFIRLETIRQLSANQPKSVIFFSHRLSQVQIYCDKKDWCRLSVKSPLDADPSVDDEISLNHMLTKVESFIHRYY